MKKQELDFIHDLLIRLDDRLDTVDQKLHSLDKTADLQRVAIEHHIKRTDLLESDLNTRTSEINNTLKPIVEHVDTVKKYSTFVLALVSGIAVLAGIWESVRGFYE